MGHAMKMRILSSPDFEFARLRADLRSRKLFALSSYSARCKKHSSSSSK